MRKLLSAAAIASLVFVGCDMFESVETASAGQRGATARDGGVGFGKVSQMEYKIGTDDLLYWRLPNDANLNEWQLDASVGKVIGIEGGYVNERPEGIPTQIGFIVKEDGNVYRSTPYGGWDRVYGASNVKDIATGGGKTFVVNVNGDIFLYDETINDGEFLWHSSLSSLGLPNNAARIDVDGFGGPWIVSDDAKVFHYLLWGKTWELVGESASYKGLDIACGDGVVYVAARKVSNSETSIFRYNGTPGVPNNGWTHFADKRAEKLDLDSHDTLRVVDYLGGISSYKYENGTLVNKGFEFDASGVNASDIGMSYSFTE